MLKLTSMTNTIPNFLYITNVEDETHLGAIGMGGFARVFRGRYEGKHVALKMVYQSNRYVSAVAILFDDVDTFCKDSLQRDVLRQAIAWRSLSHRFILPLLGVYQGKSELSLVSPFMENGTLTQWRRKQERGAIEIHRMVRRTVFVRTIKIH